MPVKEMPEHHAWLGLIQRCENPRARQYKDYGARGITVCDRWRKSFATFYRDMGPRPSRHHSLDRIDNDGPYAPNNCRWTERSIQQNNRRRKYGPLTLNGLTLSVEDWAKRLKLHPSTIVNRLAKNLSLADVLKPSNRRASFVPSSEKARNRRRRYPLFIHDGQAFTLREWGARLGVHPSTIVMRLNSGWSLAEALTAGRYARVKIRAQPRCRLCGSPLHNARTCENSLSSA